MNGPYLDNITQLVNILGIRILEFFTIFCFSVSTLFKTACIHEVELKNMSSQWSLKKKFNKIVEILVAIMLPTFLGHVGAIKIIFDRKTN